MKIKFEFDIMIRKGYRVYFLPFYRQKRNLEIIKSELHPGVIYVKNKKLEF